MGAIRSRGVIALYPNQQAIKAIVFMVEHCIRTIPIVTDTTEGAAVRATVIPVRHSAEAGGRLWP